LNEVPVEFDNDTLVDLSQLSPGVGSHTLTCEVRDTSDWIRTYRDHELLQWSGTWNLTVTEEATSARHHRGNPTSYSLRDMKAGEFDLYMPDGRRIKNPKQFSVKEGGRQLLIIKTDGRCRKLILQ
jgi:hypothetical protein